LSINPSNNQSSINLIAHLMSKGNSNQEDLIVIDLVHSSDDDDDGNDKRVTSTTRNAFKSSRNKNDNEAYPLPCHENDSHHENRDEIVKIEQNFRQAKETDPHLLFQDDEFPPLPSSIRGADGKNKATKPINCRCQGGSSQPAKLKFKPNGRPFYACSKSSCDYFSWAFTAELMHWYRFGRHNGHVLVGPNGFSAKDLCQGRVGDCWFLSALAVVAERPDLIARLFVDCNNGNDIQGTGSCSGDCSASGLIRVRLFLDGYWKTVIVDNFLPCMIVNNHNDPKTLAFGKKKKSNPIPQGEEGENEMHDSTSSSSKYNPFVLADSCQKTLHDTMEFLNQEQEKQLNIVCSNNTMTDYSLQRTVQSRDLAYSTAKHNQLWVPFLEKAYAKSHGCYSAISGGHIAEAFLDLTGAPTLVYDLHSKDFEPRSFWYKLIHYREQRLPMGCGTTSSAAGIIGMHAYSILDVREVKNVAFSFFQETGVAHGNVSGFTEYDGTVRLLQIRNPHGKGEWKGDFSDQSQIWFKLLQHHQSHPQECDGKKDDVFWTRTMCNDGTFWIDYDNFLMGFSNVDVVLAFLGNHAKSFPSNFPPNKKSNHRCARAFEVSLLDASTQSGLASTMNDTVEVYIMGIQKTRRGASKGRADRKKSYKVCDLGVLVGERSNNSAHHKEHFISVQGEMFGFRRDGHYRLILDRKRMPSCVVMPISFGHPAATDKELSFVVRFVSDAPLSIREMEQVPRMDIALLKFCLEAPPTTNKQRIRKVLVADSSYQIIQVDCRGNGGGIIYLYLCVNEEKLGIVQKGHVNSGLSFSVEATCRGMSCRTEAGLLEHEIIAKGKKFEASWRRYSAEFITEQKSRLLLVLYQSGQDTEFGGIHCKPIIAPKKLDDNMVTHQQTTLKAFLDTIYSNVDPDSEAYTRRGVFNAVSGNTAFSMAEKFHTSHNDDVVMNGFACNLEDGHDNFDLEHALAISLSENQYQQDVTIENDIEFQKVLELSRKDTKENSTICLSIDEEGPGNKAGNNPTDSPSVITNTNAYSYENDLERAIQLSLKQENQSREASTIIDLTEESPKIRKRAAGQKDNEYISAGKRLQLD